MLLRIVELGVNTQKVADMFVNKGNVYRQLKEYDTAILYYKSALRIIISINQVELVELAIVECNIAECYYNKNAKIYAKKAAEILAHNLPTVQVVKNMDYRIQ